MLTMPARTRVSVRLKCPDKQNIRTQIDMQAVRGYVIMCQCRLHDLHIHSLIAVVFVSVVDMHVYHCVPIVL